jgi:hypothetical protein
MNIKAKFLFNGLVVSKKENLKHFPIRSSVKFWISDPHNKTRNS